MMDNRHNEPDGHYYPAKPDHAYLNTLIWRTATEYMFSHRDPDVVSAEMLRRAEEEGYA